MRLAERRTAELNLCANNLPYSWGRTKVWSANSHPIIDKHGDTEALSKNQLLVSVLKWNLAVSPRSTFQLPSPSK